MINFVPLFEEYFYNDTLLESKQQELLKKFLKQQETIDVWKKLDGIEFKTRSGEYTFNSEDPNNTMTIRAYLMSNFNDLMRYENCKYQLAIGRLFTELIQSGDQNQEAEFSMNMKSIIKAVHGTEDDNFDLSGKHMNQLKSEYNQKIKERNDEVLNSLKDYKVQNHGNYTVKRIHNFEEAQEYYKYVSDLNIPWCVTESRGNWDGYSSNDVNAIYFLLRNGFEKLHKPEKMPENAPYDEYGLSMMFISVSPDGMIQNITSRWNHDCDNTGSGKFEGYGISDTHFFEKDGDYDLKRLSDLIGYNILEVCKPNTFEDILKKFKDISELDSEYIYAKTNGETYIIFNKETNKPVSNKIYKEILHFSEGLARVVLNGKYGFIDKTGKEVVPCKYNAVIVFKEGLARVVLNGKWGVIDKTGNEVIPCKYDSIDDFMEGLACVVLNSKYGFIDKTGKEVVPCKYYYATHFNEGLARVESNYRYGFIDKTGREVVPCKYDNTGNFKEGLACVKLKSKYGFIDKTGKEVIPCKYDFVDDFSEGLARVVLNGKWGVIDKTGNEVIPCKYDSIDDFMEGLACVVLNSKYGFIDKTGKEVVPCKYYYATHFNEGLARVELNGKWGVIDKTGKEIAPCKYNTVGDFKEGLARVRLNGKSGFIDKTGKEVIPCKYDFVDDFKEGVARVKLNYKYGVIDKTGNEVVPCKYDGVSSFNDGLACVILNGKSGFIDKTGKWYDKNPIRLYESIGNDLRVPTFLEFIRNI